jgi:hypothetical protein
VDDVRTPDAEALYLELAKAFDAGDLAVVHTRVAPDVEYLVFGSTELAGFYRGPGAATALSAKILSMTRGKVVARETLYGDERLLLTRTTLNNGIELFLSQEYDGDRRLRRVSMMITGER